jgi:transcriptional regulator with XRE-family HTH domain
MEKSAFNKILGSYIRKIRIDKGFTQQQLADKLGLDFQYISRIERGLISPTLYWISDLAKALDCDEGDFLVNFVDFKRKTYF